MRTTFIDTLTALAREDKDIVLLTGDLGFRIFDNLRAVLGPRFINAGVAESNMVSVAASMALMGKKVYCYSMAPFLVMRAFEQVRVDICAHKAPVRLVGIGAGLGYPMEGITHHAFEDVALMRSLPGMTVVAPGDKLEARMLTESSLDFAGPLYLRLARDSADVVHQELPKVGIGKAIRLNNDGGRYLLSSGPMLATAHAVASKLKAEGTPVSVWSVPTIKPLDMGLIESILSEATAVVSLEEHSVIGGLGSAVSEILLERGFRGDFMRLGLPDSYFEAVGDNAYLRSMVGLDDLSVYKSISALFNSKPGHQAQKAQYVR